MEAATIGIEEAETPQRAMIDEITSPSILLPEYRDAVLPGFVPGIEYLATKYTMRRIRGDGNCFYRAFLFSYLEQLLNCHNGTDAEKKAWAIAERDRIQAIFVKCKDDLVALGYSEVAIECFHDMVIDLIADIFSYTNERLLAEFQEDGQSDYFTWFMRLLTSGAMLLDQERFFPFVVDDATMDVQTYVKREVEPMGKECEQYFEKDVSFLHTVAVQVQIIALSEYLGIQVRIEYLDGRPLDTTTGCLSVIAFPESVLQSAASVTLLYRPGHYDILYNI